MRVILQDGIFKDTKSSVKYYFRQVPVQSRLQFSQVLLQSSNSSVKSHFNKVIAQACSSSVHVAVQYSNS